MAEEKPELFLFVWSYFCPPFADRMAFAIAETEEDAKHLINSKRKTAPMLWGPVQRHPVTEPIAFYASGGA